MSLPVIIYPEVPEQKPVQSITIKVLPVVENSINIPTNIEDEFSKTENIPIKNIYTENMPTRNKEYKTRILEFQDFKSEQFYAQLYFVLENQIYKQTNGKIWINQNRKWSIQPYINAFKLMKEELAKYLTNYKYTPDIGNAERKLISDTIQRWKKGNLEEHNNLVKVLEKFTLSDEELIQKGVLPLDFVSEPEEFKSNDDILFRDPQPDLVVRKYEKYASNFEAFMEECVRFTRNNKDSIVAKELYYMYTMWCEQKNEIVCDIRVFGKMTKARGVQQIKSGGVSKYLYIKIIKNIIKNGESES